MAADRLALRALASLLVNPTAPPLGWIGLDALHVTHSTALRNRGPAPLAYRPVGGRGERYPEWVQALRGKSGVYVIRDRGTRETLYVGESHTGNLYETMTRHLQQWRRWKSYWLGQYRAESDHDPGLVYDRNRVEVAARVLSPDDALDEEIRLISKLRPRDNLNLTPF